MSDFSRPTEDAVVRRLGQIAKLRQFVKSQRPLTPYDTMIWEQDRSDPLNRQKLASRLRMPIEHLNKRLHLISTILLLEEMER